jgi:hypothetical protein
VRCTDEASRGLVRVVNGALEDVSLDTKWWTSSCRPRSWEYSAKLHACCFTGFSACTIGAGVGIANGSWSLEDIVAAQLQYQSHGTVWSVRDRASGKWFLSLWVEGPETCVLNVAPRMLQTFQTGAISSERELPQNKRNEKYAAVVPMHHPD